ncbi:hypothetical protein Spith_0271 [Spirochaeta thermophila DSM 6578]|uniref:Uncharacterized protein n=1 Tax=Winmispira thermophila (strain ATCC 700085 / DSM 6578 / Z-1203) TaxID=869211 RepID=G0GDD1_WINT7|nr:hypothetical protein [Spirochaeta thermophila]AEJ60557.1 hypothetical protein Spith_0271 [Spirochaeta thermophila DSM 6578]
MIDRRPKFSLCVALLLAGIVSLSAQELSTRQEVAVFKVYNAAGNVPEEVIASLSEMVRATVVKMGRFDVIGYSQSISSGDLDSFIARLKEYKEAAAEIPEEVLMGHEAFTEADFRRLVGSFMVIVPQLSLFELERTRAGYKSYLRLDVTVYNVADDSVESQFSIEADGASKTRTEALTEALDMVPTFLEYELRKAFVVRTTVLEVEGGEIYLEFGRNMGLQVGDEFVLLLADISPLGRERVRESGLLLVKEVQEDYSVAIPLYAARRPTVGDQLQEVPRVGVEVLPYLNYVVSPQSAERDENVASFGVRATVSRGFFDFRPTVGFEFPFRMWALVAMIFDYIPIQTYVGAEITNWYLGRLQIAPTLVVGAGGLFPLEEERDEGFLVITHFGGKAFLSLSYLVSRDVKLTVEPGFSLWFGLADEALGDLIDVARTYYGPSFSLAVTFKQ